MGPWSRIIPREMGLDRMYLMFGRNRRAPNNVATAINAEYWGPPAQARMSGRSNPNHTYPYKPINGRNGAMPHMTVRMAIRSISRMGVRFWTDGPMARREVLSAGTAM